MENNLTKYILYCTVCTVNNKIYIGVHKTNPNKFDGYIGCGVYITNCATYERSKTAFQQAVKEFGPKSFIRQTIAVCDTEEEAYLLEEDIVNEEFLARPDVYNQALGGKIGLAGWNSIPVYQYDELGNYINEYDSIKDASRYINRNFSSLYKAVLNKSKCANYFWTTIKYETLDLSKMHNYENSRKLPIFLYDNLGNYECCYEGIRDAARILNIPSGNLSKAIKLGVICYNKYFTTTYAPTFTIAKSTQITSLRVYQYDLEGNFIAEYKNMQEAKNTLHIKTNIYDAIKLKRLAGGFQWSFEKLEKMPKILPKSGRPRRVGKFDKNWNLIKEYNTLQECKNENGSGLIHVLDGRDQFAKGFRYKYLD